MTEIELDPTPAQDLSALVGYNFIYRYGEGMIYEVYVKNAHTIDYRIHTGPLAGRWVKDQTADIVQLADDCFKISWTEPTGTSVVVNLMPTRRLVHGSAFFPHWIEQDFSKTVLFQNDHLDEMHAYRDAGPAYPTLAMTEFARILFTEYVGTDDETIIAAPPASLPTGFAERMN